MEFRLLGAIEVAADGGSLPLGGPRQRAVLADLAIHAGRTVSTAQLIDDLWGERPPLSAIHTMEAYISRLRRTLSASGTGGVALISRPGGYMLEAPPDDVDLWRFRKLAARADAALERGDATAAITLGRSALATWRGPALADIRNAAFARLAAHGMEDERLNAAETFGEARLRQGHHRELVPELETLIAGSPYRERFHAQLMLALYRSERQADALSAFKRARDLLTGELGIEPGRELRELERAILLQSPELEPVGVGALRRPLHPAARPVPAVPAAARGRRVWRWAAAVAVAGALVAAGLSILLTAVPTHAKELTNGVGELNTAGSGIMRGLALPTLPGAALSADGSVWVTSPEGDVVYRIDPATAAITQKIPVGSGPSAIAAGGPDIWVANTLDGTISRINAKDNAVVQVVRVGTEPTGIAVGGGSVWVADASAGTLTALNPTSGRRRTVIPLASAPFGVAFGGGSVWVTSPAANSVIRVDPQSGEPGQQIEVGSGPTAIAFGRGSVWVANGLDSTVSRVDPSTDAVRATISVGGGPDALAITGNSVWAADRLSSALTRIAVGGDTTAAVIRVGDSPTALTTAGHHVWFAGGPTGTRRPVGGTLRVVTNVGPPSIDPATLYPNTPVQFSDDTYDTLVTFQKTGGSAGLLLVPDLAIDMPSVNAAGTAYTFTLRPGLRYSTGRLVRPEDFRHALERVLQLNTTAGSFLNGIVGAAACVPAKRCDLARGVLTDDSARTVTFRLTGPDPDFLDKLAFGFTAPVPADVRDRRVGASPVPGTGPYMVARTIPGRQVVFTRNPYFWEWSEAAQPDGSPDRIIWSFGSSFTREAAEIETGRADWTNDPLPDVAGLSARFPSQVHVSPLPAIVYTAFNTRVAPFDDPRVRRAFSLVANRRRLVGLLGGPDQADPSCQILPPGIPGHRPFCPFTTGAGPAGRWVGPAIDAARRLITASGTKGMRVTVWSDRQPPDNATGPFTVSVLRELGYRARLHLTSHAAVVEATNDSRRRIQATDGAWQADYPSASDFFDLFFRCSASRPADPADTRNGSFFCDPRADRLMRRADSEQLNNPVQAAKTWAAVDRLVTTAAPWVPLATLNNVDFLSARVTNYQYNPFLGVLLDQLRIRPRR